MSAIHSLDELAASAGPHRDAWTAIIPAAGRGSRLGFDRPKILYPLLGRTMLEWVLDAVRPTCARVVLVVSPDGSAAVEAKAASILGGDGTIVEQPAPTGMGDAVLLTRSAIQTPYALVVWGDQVTLRARTVAACARAHEARAGAVLTLPTVLRRDPYIHFERDAQGNLLRVLQAREGQVRVATGENDCGLFLFTAQALFTTLSAARSRGVGMGATTHEFNLVQTLPLFESGPGAVATVRLPDPSETLGVNTREDARVVEEVLRGRGEERATPRSGGTEER